MCVVFVRVWVLCACVWRVCSVVVVVRVASAVSMWYVCGVWPVCACSQPLYTLAAFWGTCHAALSRDLHPHSPFDPPASSQLRDFVVSKFVSNKGVDVCLLATALGRRSRKADVRAMRVSAQTPPPFLALPLRGGGVG